MVELHVYAVGLRPLLYTAEEHVLVITLAVDGHDSASGLTGLRVFEGSTIIRIREVGKEVHPVCRPELYLCRIFVLPGAST